VRCDPVWTATTFTFVGKALTSSIQVRSDWRPETWTNSGMLAVKSRVTLMTAAESGPKLSMSKAAMMFPRLKRFTAWEIAASSPALMS
jgi:hypothetical protein